MRRILKLYLFFLIPKLNEPHRDHDIFDYLYFLTVQVLVLRAKYFFSHFFDDILTLGSGSVDPFIFTDPNPVSQNVADPTDPDPKD